MNNLSETFSVIFHLRIERLQDEKMPVYARITINGKRIEISLKHKIAISDWNDKTGMAKNNNPEGKSLNKFMEQTRASLVSCYREMTLQRKNITTETFKKEYYGGNEDEYTLSKLMHYHNVDMKEALSWGTIKNYFTTQKYL